MTIELPDEFEKRLTFYAEQRGMSPDQYAADLIARQLPPDPHEGQSLAELFAQWDAEDATDDPTEIIRRQQEADELMTSLARGRIDMVGPDAARTG